MDSQTLYTIRGGDQHEYGPVSTEQVREWIAQRRADGRTLARAGDAGEWQPLAEFPAFADALRAPPPAPPPVAVDGNALVERILAEERSLSIGDCFSRGWVLFRQRVWLFSGITALFVLLTVAAGSVPLGSIVLFGPLVGGWSWVFLKQLRGEPASLEDFFAGFSSRFLPLMAVGILYQLLCAIGLVLLILPGIYLLVVWRYAPLLALDKGLDFWPAMETSRRVVHQHWWTLFSLFLLGTLLYLAGALMCLVGAFFTVAFAEAACICAYETLFGERPGAADAR
jgi:hypothetical protein